MENILVAVLAALAGAALVALLLRRTARPAEAPPWEASGEFAALRAEVQGLAGRMTDDGSRLAARLEGIEVRMASTQDRSAELAQGVFQTLGEMRNATSIVAEQAREFRSLQDVLKPPKARGGLGEAMLEELLRQVLPPQSYSTQHRFRNGTFVDAVVRAGGKLVCIDSKFPLSNYHRLCDATTEVEKGVAERAFAADVDRHIKDIASKYILPNEDTFEFAVMYVPAEGVYGEFLRLSHRSRSLFEQAIEARVMPMSPLTLYGYLQTVLFGLKCLRIEQGAQEILDYCGRLQVDMKRFADEYDTLGRHIGNARTKYEEGRRSLDLFRDHLERTIELGDDQDPPRSLEAVGE